MTKKTKIFILLGCIILILASFLSIWYLGATFPDFDANERFKVPALNEGFVPKGICRVGKLGCWLVAGYMANGKASRVYVINQQTAEVIKFFTVKDDTTILDVEFSGVASNDSHVWLVANGQVYHLDALDIFNVSDGHPVKVVDKFDTGTKADFCFANSKYFVVGETSGSGKNKVQGHEFMDTDDKENHAYALCFLTGNGKYGLDSDNYGRIAPNKVYSIPDKVESFCMAGDNLVLYRGGRLDYGEFLVYNTKINSKVVIGPKVNVMDNVVPLNVLWYDNADKIKCPSACEDLEYYYGEVFAVYSSASRGKNVLNRTSEKMVLSFSVH
ncbi:MAG: hypothetical protein IKV38_00195 [Clostridia bacterium]|nr:hypothetical protein [Clostridia bacterium]